jgi:hypothetical protein
MKQGINVSSDSLKTVVVHRGSSTPHVTNEVAGDVPGEATGEVACEVQRFLKTL